MIYKGGVWKPEWETIKGITISSSMIEVIIKRIDLIDKELMEMLSQAAVIGRKFKIELLYTLVQKPMEELIGLIDNAIEVQLLERSTERGEILFVHDRIKDAFYKR